MGTRRRFFFPFFDRALMTSSVWGLSHGSGPTFGREEERGREEKREGGRREKFMNLRYPHPQSKYTNKFSYCWGEGKGKHNDL